MSATRPICVLVGALGGQGGRVLADWMAEAAALAGYPAQSTSIAGVAQRTGATTYYFELFPEREPEAAPIFSLFPDSGEVDLMAALEPAEATRAMSRGLITRDTIVISTLDRQYSTAEKMDAGDGRIDSAQLADALASGCKRLVTFTLPRGSGAQLNAMMFGAIAGCGILPLTIDDCRHAIAARAVAAESNLKGFEAGLALSARADTAARNGGAPAYDPPPSGFESKLVQLPAPLRAVAGHCVARVADYQDRAYAELFLARIGKVIEADSGAGTAGWRLSRIVAERLASWMSYEDAARVAQHKTRPGRIARIRAEIGAGAEEPLDVIDYLKPADEELKSLLPAALEWMVPGFLTRGVAMRVRSSSPAGFALLRMLSAMRRVRPRTTRFAREQEAIEAWLDAVIATAAHDYELAVRTAELAIWARGYGRVRTRGLSALNVVLDQWKTRLENNRGSLAAEVERSLYRARHDPEAACAPAAQMPRAGEH